MGMIVTRIDFQLGEHRSAQLILWHHAFHRFLDDHFRGFHEQLVERDRLNASRISSVVLIQLVCRLIASNHDLFRINNDDIVAGINVRCEFWLMLASETVRNLST